jgi:hypothetical protein
MASMPDQIFWLPSTGVNLRMINSVLDGLDNRPAAESIIDAHRILFEMGKVRAEYRGPHRKIIESLPSTPLRLVI